MFTPRLMLIFAQGILLIGVVSLVPAAWRLFHRATEAGMPTWHIWWIIPLFLVAGTAKAVFVMRKRMRLNIRRIAGSSVKLWPWQIYPPQMLAFILAMVVLMYVMKRVLTDSGLGLGLLGGVDVAVAMALLIVSREYRRPLD